MHLLLGDNLLSFEEFMPLFISTLCLVPPIDFLLTLCGDRTCWGGRYRLLNLFGVSSTSWNSISQLISTQMSKILVTI